MVRHFRGEDMRLPCEGLTGWVEFKVHLQVGMPEVALLLCENKEQEEVI